MREPYEEAFLSIERALVALEEGRFRSLAEMEKPIAAIRRGAIDLINEIDRRVQVKEDDRG